MNLHIQNSDSIEKIIGGYILRIPSFRPKMKLKQSHSVENEKGFLTSVSLQNIKKLKWDPLKALKRFRKKSQRRKKLKRETWLDFAVTVVLLVPVKSVHYVYILLSDKKT